MKQKGFALVLLLLIIAITTISIGGVYYYRNFLSKKVSQPQIVTTQSPTPTPTQAQTATKCEVNDMEFCQVLEIIKNLVDKRDFTTLVNYQDTLDYICDPDGMGYNADTCQGIPKGGHTQAYNIGWLQSEGAFYNKAEYIKQTQEYFSQYGPFHFYSIGINKDKGFIVFRNEGKSGNDQNGPKSELFVLIMRKEGSVWRIWYQLVGGNYFKDLASMKNHFLTLGWKIYSGKELTFNYPSDWSEISVKTQNSNIIVELQDSTGKYNVSLIKENNSNPNTKKPYNSLNEFLKIGYSLPTVSVDGQQGVQSLPRAGSENRNSVVFFSKDFKFIYNLNLIAENVDEAEIQEGQKLFNQILPTFKFTN